MPYKSEDELEEDMSENPKLAKMRISRAKASNLPLVSKNNPGYTDNKNSQSKAITKRMGKMKPGLASKKPATKMSPSDVQNAISRRIATRTQPPKDDDIVEKRKKVGY